MRRVTAGFIVIALVLALVSCSKSDDDGATGDGGGGDTTDGTTSDAEPTPGGTIAFGLAAESGGFNPSSDQFNLSGYQVAQAIYDRLVAYDEDDQAKPYLAESIEPNDDFTEWVITLRPDIVFHDGTPLDSEVLRMNLQATKDSPLLGQVFTLVESIDIVDDLSVKVTMSEPWATFPHTLTAQPGLIAAPSVFEDPEGSSHPVGTGPFVLDTWVRDDHLSVTRNEDYWREGFPYLDGIDFKILTDSESLTSSMQSGDIDMGEIRKGEQVAGFEADDDFVVYLDQQGETTESVLFMNTAIPPFDDPLAREAVSYGTDRDTISEQVYGGRFPPANGPFKENSPWYQGVEFASYDPDPALEAAQAYEAAHGEPITFTITLVPDPVTEIQTQLLQQMYGDLGMQVDLKTGEGTQVLLDVLGGNYQLSGVDALWGSTNPDRETTFLPSANALPVGQLATNFTRVQDDQIDEGIAEARQSGDMEGQIAGWKKVQEGLARTMGWVFLVHDDVGTVATPDIQDVTTWEFPDGTPGLPQEQNTVPMYQIWLDQ